MRILITGSKGTIGSKLFDLFERKGYEVFGVDLLHHEGEIGFIQRMSNENGNMLDVISENIDK